MSDYILSDKEQKLYDTIKNSEFDVTVKAIEIHLGKEYVGALGKLLSLGIIKSAKKNLEIIGKDLNPYGHKWVKCYFVNKEGKK